jgi:hypothetical protein
VIIYTVTDSDVQLSENIDTASSRALQTDNDSQTNRSLLNNDTETAPIESIVDRNNLIKLQQADTSLARYFEKIQETPDEKSWERFFSQVGCFDAQMAHSLAASGAARHKKSRRKKAPGTKKVDAKSQTLTKTLN